MRHRYSDSLIVQHKQTNYAIYKLLTQNDNCFSHAVVSFLLAARLSPRAVPATRHQTTTKPAVQAEKRDLAQPTNTKSKNPNNRERNPGNYFQNNTILLFYGLEQLKINLYFIRIKKNIFFNQFFHMYGVLGLLTNFRHVGVQIRFCANMVQLFLILIHLLKII